MRIHFPTIVVLIHLLAASSSAQQSPDGVWSAVSPGVMGAAQYIPLSGGEFSSFQLDNSILDSLLATTLPDTLLIPDSTRTRIYLPHPDGRYEEYFVFDSPILSDSLQTLYPELRTYSGISVDDADIRLRFGQLPGGFTATVSTSDGTFMVTPHQPADTAACISFWTQDVPEESDYLGCLVDTEFGPASVPVATTGATLRIFNIAVTASGEYSQAFQPSPLLPRVAFVREAILNTMNYVSLIYQRDAAIRFLISHYNIYEDPAADIFPDHDQITGQLIAINHQDLDLKYGDWDIGHLFTRAQSQSGLAYVGACNPGNKGAAGSCSDANPMDPFFVPNIVAHEIGHQLGADHTFNSTSSVCGPNKSPLSAYEPGPGSTIMSYAFHTCDFRIVTNADDYFHAHSIDQIVSYLNGSGACYWSVSNYNLPPSVNAGSDYIIPRDTPFTLTASGTDPDGDILTYCWEQMDREWPLGGTLMYGPLFRSRPPTVSASRTFPKFLRQGWTPSEVSPSLDRVLKFRCTVRDMEGGVASDDIVVTVQGEAFEITSPDGSSPVAGCGSLQLTWNVGGGSTASTVDILLSLDNGATFFTLLANTENDGSANVNLPCLSVTDARFIIKPNDQIFFAYSNQIEIVGPPTFQVPGSALTISDAIELASLGDIVLVSPGEYPESIEMKTGVSVMANPGSMPVIDSGPTLTAVTFPGSSDENTKLDGFILSGGSSHVVSLDGDGQIINCEVDGLKHATPTGVLVNGGTPTLRDSRISGSTQTGVMVLGGFLSMPTGVVEASQFGIHVQSPGLISLGKYNPTNDREVTVRDCSIGGIVIDSAPSHPNGDPNRLEHVIVEGHSASPADWVGIHLLPGSSSALLRCTVQDALGPNSVGMFVESTAELLGIKVENIFSGNGVGILFDTTDPSLEMLLDERDVTDNLWRQSQVRNCYDGIRINTIAEPVIRNSIIENHVRAIHIGPAAVPDLGRQSPPSKRGNNSILNSTLLAGGKIRIFGMPDVQAEMNYWGSSTPDPSQIKPWIDYVPYLGTDPNPLSASRWDMVSADSSPQLLKPSYPMPFSGSVSIPLFVDQADQQVSVNIYDLAGRRVKELKRGLLGPGEHVLVWDGIHADGTHAANGVYFVSAVVGLQRGTRKLILLR